MILHTLNDWMEAIESHPWFVLLDMAFHLFIIGHVVHHVWHASHRHLWPRIALAGTQLQVAIIGFLVRQVPVWALTPSGNMRLMVLYVQALDQLYHRERANAVVPTAHDHKHRPWQTNGR